VRIAISPYRAEQAAPLQIPTKYHGLIRLCIKVN
jgi:hypothetical protein